MRERAKGGGGGGGEGEGAGGGGRPKLKRVSLFNRRPRLAALLPSPASNPATRHGSTNAGDWGRSTAAGAVEDALCWWLTFLCSSPPPLLPPGAAPPAWLKGDLPGDRGFDPMGLGADPKALAW